MSRIQWCRSEANETADLIFRKFSVVHILAICQHTCHDEEYGYALGRWRTLYQCFFTLPSVRVGNVLAISLQLLPASLKVFSLCSSAGVQGVLVRPFFATVGLGRCA